MKRKPRAINLIGQRFGRLIVIDRYGKDKHKHVLWLCRCQCGNESIVTRTNLIVGTSQSCGCLHKELSSKRVVKDITGKKFGRLLVIQEAGRNKHGCVLWECICDCGNEKIVVGTRMISGRTKSCGCYQKETITRIASESCGELAPNWRGGLKAEPYCQVWVDTEYKEYIFERDGYQCLNPMCPKTSDRLCRHHIDYDKKNCSKENVITVCNPCNTKANFDRKWHTSWYRAILSKRYNYVY